ncbi:MAG: helix-turn-helix transcriptional regulator [Novosphingobium sp.]|nr:helix-turn-helix transcriptional regulator [Novosphingobium sp.]
MLTHDEIRDELIAQIDRGDIKQAEVARSLGIPPARVAEIRKRERRIQPNEMPALARLLKLDESGVVPDLPRVTNVSESDDVVEIIALDLSLSMGPGTLIEEFVEEEPLKFDMGLLRAITRSPFARLRIVKGVGDSMEPTLRTSDRVLIDTTEKALSRVHGVYWIDHFGAHGLKRLRPAGQGRVLIVSDNPSVPDYDVDAEEIRIHGRAIWLMRDL